MKVEIIDRNKALDIYGFSGVAINRDYTRTAFQLMDKMWNIVKTRGLKHKGINIWIYEPDEKIFAGVEVCQPIDPQTGLEHKAINLQKYAYYKHVGPYSLLKQAGQNMKEELQRQGVDIGFIYVEMYGHWTNDESKLETELLISLR